jgi:hypothetical protein
LSRNAGAKCVGDFTGAIELECDGTGSLPTPDRLYHLRRMLEHTISALNSMIQREAA